VSQHCEQDHIGCTITNQQLAGTLIAIERPTIPEMNRQLTVGVLQVHGTSESESRCDALQASLETFVITGPAQVEVRTRQFRNMKRVEHTGHVERTAIE
jgi:hypothetical protein